MLSIEPSGAHCKGGLAIHPPLEIFGEIPNLTGVPTNGSGDVFVNLP